MTTPIAPRLAEAKYAEFVETALTFLISGGLAALAIGAALSS